MEKIKLKDGKTYNIEAGAVSNQVTMVVSSLEEMTTRISTMTAENLEIYQILNDADMVCSVYENKVVDHFEGKAIKGTENYRVIFYMVDIDMVAKRLKALEDTTDMLVLDSLGMGV